ncbi:MAG: hypothetical protein FJ217_05515 [Ignavibacteria bacterium]|nr:hypothetical protein [Ignavibacteria bacterium]
MSDAQIFHIIVTEFPYALMGSIIAGALCAYVGVYLVSMRVVFVGATMTQVAVAGIALAHLPVIEVEPVFGSIFLTVLVTLLVARLLQSRKIPRDSVLGITFIVAMAILLVFYMTAGLVVSVATRVVGDVLVFGFLVIPAVTAILLAKKVRNIFWLAVGFLGLYFAFKLDPPAGPATVATGFIILSVAWIVNRFRR